MKNIILIWSIFCIIILTGCGDSIKDAVENLEITKDDSLIDMLKNSKLIDNYEIIVISDDELRGEVVVRITLKKDAVISSEDEYNDKYLKIVAHIYLSQSIQKGVWTFRHIDLKGQFFDENRQFGELLNLYPPILVKLSENKKLSVGKIRYSGKYFCR